MPDSPVASTFASTAASTTASTHSNVNSELELFLNHMSESHMPAGSESLTETDLSVAVAIVRRAAAIAATMRDEGLVTEYKTSISDVVTAADRAAEGFVVKALAALRPDDGILGEEGSAKESASGRTWVIDPVDGTYNFTTGSDYWCSALALVEGEVDNPLRLILGAVHRPTTGETWVGGPEIPTKRINNDGTASDLSIRDAEPAAVCAATYLHTSVVGHNPVTDSWLDAASRFATWRMLGSASMDMAGVADGRLGTWFQRDVAPWDWLPGRALVEGSGGECAKVGRWRVAGAPRQVAELRGVLR